MPGPRPKSEELRRAQGSRHHRKTKKKTARHVPPAAAIEPAPAPAPPVLDEDRQSRVDPPAWLSAKSKTIWRIAAPVIVRQGLLRDTDAIAFGRYCDWLGQYLELQKGSRRRKVVTETKSKHVKMQRMDKSFQALQMVDKTLRDYEDRFGMNPRERLAIMKALAESNTRPPGAPPAKPNEPDGLGGHVETPEPLPRSPVGYLGSGVKH